MIKFLSILLFIFNFYRGEQPLSTCNINKPLRTKDNRCANFNDVCLIKGDLDCNNFQSACKQCPPSNYSVLMYIDIINVKDDLIRTKSELANLKVQSQNHVIETVQIKKKQNDLFILLVVTIILIVICLFLVIGEIRFKIITKIFGIGCEKRKKYDVLKSRKHEYLQEENENLQKQLKESVSNVNNKLEFAIQQLVDSIDLMMDTKMNVVFSRMEKMLNTTNLSTKFQINGIEKPIELIINYDETIVKIKREICEKLSISKPNDYKIMKMKYNGFILDDNDYLLARIGSPNVTINCEFDTTIKSNDIMVLRLKGNTGAPKLLQMNRNQTIVDLKNILFRFNVPKDAIILKDLTKLMDESSLNECKLIDEDWLTVIAKEQKELIISSIFDEKTRIAINYFTTDFVETIKINVAHKFNSDPDFYVLFIKNQYLDERKYIYEYEIENEFSVKCCCITKLNGIEIGEIIHKGFFSELLKAKDKETSKEMLLNKYDSFTESKLKDNKHILKELSTFQITKSHKRFVQLFNIYNLQRFVFVAMENMAEGTIKLFLKKNGPLKNNLTRQWSLQILQGLKHLHDNKIIHRDLNPSSILVDAEKNIKLYSFNLSKYEDYHNPSSVLENLKNKEKEKKEETRNENAKLPTGLLRYMAPEILESRGCGEETDVWSFGAVLIKIVTGKGPYSGSNKEDIVKKICSTNYITYELENNDPSLKDLIDSCLKDQKDRLTIQQLMNHDYINKPQT